MVLVHKLDRFARNLRVTLETLAPVHFRAIRPSRPMKTVVGSPRTWKRLANSSPSGPVG